jgi:isopenicillin N synthase-like dioxygenase
MTSIPVVDLSDLRAGGERRAAFVAAFGEALEVHGFVAVRGHNVDKARLKEAYDTIRAFYALSDAQKRAYEIAGAHGQRGFTSYGKEHAKGESAPDMKEFFQIARPDVPDTHVLHEAFGPNVWPSEVPAFETVMSKLFVDLDSMGRDLLGACAEYLGDDANWYTDAVREGDTILRVIHYPPVAPGQTPNSIRAGAHEDINFITLLVGATEPGLELLLRDGTWMPIQAEHDEIIVDSGDMLQNVTNGRMRSTTHRVTRPANEAEGVPRFSMPCFIHPRGEVDLTPRAACVASSGGVAKYPSISARAYLVQRLKEIGIG